MNRKIFFGSIVTSLISSLLISYIFEPFTIWFWALLSDSAYNWANNLQTHAIKNAAMGIRPWVSATGFIIGIMTLSLILLFTVIWILVQKYFISSRDSSNLVSKQNDKKVSFSYLNNSFMLLNALYFLYISIKLSFTVYVDLQMNSSFLQRTTALKPYITQREYDILKSDWSLMENHEDYTKINLRLENLSKNTNIKLPVPLYK